MEEVMDGPNADLLDVVNAMQVSLGLQPITRDKALLMFSNLQGKASHSTSLGPEVPIVYSMSKPSRREGHQEPQVRRQGRVDQQDSGGVDSE